MIKPYSSFHIYNTDTDILQNRNESPLTPLFIYKHSYSLTAPLNIKTVANLNVVHVFISQSECKSHSMINYVYLDGISMRLTNGMVLYSSSKLEKFMLKIFIDILNIQFIYYYICK